MYIISPFEIMVDDSFYNAPGTPTGMRQQGGMMLKQKQYRVVELPECSTGQQIEDALNEVAEADYRLVRFTACDPGVAIRSIWCLRSTKD